MKCTTTLLTENSINIYNFKMWKEEPVQVIQAGKFHTSVRCKGFTFLADNDDIMDIKENFLVVFFYKGQEIRVLQEYTTDLLIETQSKEKLKVRKTELEFILCRINENVLLSQYVKKYGKCFLIRDSKLRNRVKREKKQVKYYKYPIND